MPGINYLVSMLFAGLSGLYVGIGVGFPESAALNFGLAVFVGGLSILVALQGVARALKQ